MLKSIALHYKQEKNIAPEVLAKGEGEIAEKILKIAEKFNIPLYKDNILADILYKINIGYEVPEYLYDVIAEIYAFTYQILKKE